MDTGNGWSGSEVRGSRRLNALIADTEEWIHNLESDAHWAQTRTIREEKTRQASILRDLLERAR